MISRQGRDPRLPDQRPAAIALAVPAHHSQRPGRVRHLPAGRRRRGVRFRRPRRPHAAGRMRRGDCRLPHRRPHPLRVAGAHPSVRGSANGTPVMRTIATPGSKIRSLTTRAVTRVLAWLDGHAEVPVRDLVPCDVRPDRRSWPYTTRSGLWPEEATGMPAVPGEAWRQSLLAACVLFMARTGAGRGRRRASTCRRWLPAGSRSG